MESWYPSGGLALGLGWVLEQKKGEKEKESQKQAMDQMLSGFGSGSACVAAAVVAVHGGKPAPSEKQGLGRASGPKNVLQYASSWKIHHKFHATNMGAKLFICSSKCRTAHVPRPSHPSQPIPSRSIPPTAAGDFYLYIHIRTPERTDCCSISTRRSVLNAYLQSLNSINDRMTTTIGNSWHSQFCI